MAIPAVTCATSLVLETFAQKSWEMISVYLPERLSTPIVAVHPQSDMLRLLYAIVRQTMPQIMWMFLQHLVRKGREDSLLEGNVIGTGLEEVDEEMVRLAWIRIETFVELKSELTVGGRAGDFVVDSLLSPIITIIFLACDGRNERRAGRYVRSGRLPVVYV